MANHILAPYWAPTHRREADYTFFRELKPPVVKIMDGGRPDYEWVRNNLPNATLVMRDWLIDDNHGNVWRETLANPVATGAKVAHAMIAKAKSLGLTPHNVLLMGPSNEPNVWVPGGIKAAVDSTVSFADTLAREGWRGLLLNLSVGWPANSDTATQKNTPPDWVPYKPVEAALRRGDHMLGLHEYWKSTGVADGWGWYGGRALKCPWDVPIIIGECGYSYAVGRSGIPTPEQGWQRHISDEQYAEQIVQYHNLMAKDHRIKGLCLFLCDYASPEWWSKDVEPAYDNILRRKSQLAMGATTPVTPKPPVPPVTPPPTKPEPVPPTGRVAFRFPLDSLRVTQWWSRTHGGIDYGTVVNTPVKACADGRVVWVDDDRKTKAKNGGYGLYVRIYHPQLKIHTFYAHLNRQDVKVGDTVKMGQTIGMSGNTGNSTGPHLHFEVRLANDSGGYDRASAGETYNARIDPMAWFAGFRAG